MEKPFLRQSDFALIGHMESWAKLERVVNALRGPALPPMASEDIREIIGWIPPRTVVKIETHSIIPGCVSNGLYIDTFITPDDLAAGAWKKSVEKVRLAADYAVREGAKLVSLGGFTSIVLESEQSSLADKASQFTTGNSLTAHFIVDGFSLACAVHGVQLGSSRLLIVGATGDIGSACAAYMGSRVQELVLCARNQPRLERLAAQLSHSGAKCRITTDPSSALAESDIVLLAASMPGPMLDLSLCPPHAIVCDAGYPRNSLGIKTGFLGERLFYGGMGLVTAGFWFTPDLIEAFYDYYTPFVAHGCMLEGLLLGLEKRFEAFSTGRGNITPERIAEIARIANKHGYVVAPFFNENGLWQNQPTMKMREELAN
jgi:predicted amino acid dehydrogenase